MKRLESSLPGVLIIEPDVFSDERGFFFESYNQAKFAELGIPDHFLQDNHSKSTGGTLRGLHYQLNHPQAKLCRVVRGEVLDVVVDIRRGSPCFGKHETILLTAENMRQIYIPAGFAHGFLVLSDTAEFLYKCSDFYYPDDDRGVAWDDPEIGIDWGIKEPVLSDKDRNHLKLSEIAAHLLPEYDGGDE